MGSMFSKPKMPTSSYSYTPTPSSTTTSPVDTTTGGDTTGTDAEKIAAITRRRSFPDTIQTSWRGVLQQGSWAPQRKSLLGE